MYTKQEIIIRSYLKGESQRSISRSLQISRKTVKKYITEYEQRLQGSKDKKDTQSKYLSEEPVFKKSTRQKYKLTDTIISAIDEHLQENEKKLQSGLRKQLLKKCDIYEALIAQGFDISYTTVCNYIRSKASVPAVRETFIRQQYQPGESCEFDWGEVKIYIKGELKKFQLAVFTGTYSNYRYGRIYNRQDTLAFQESHVDFFERAGGVYRCMIYDNMRVAVAKFVGKHEKEPTQALLQLRGHYHFTHRFCNARRGNEKGHVERSVEYVRRKSFGVKYKFDNMEEAHLWLQKIIDKLNNTRQQLSGKTAQEMFEEEKQVLFPAQTRMACTERIKLRVDKYATVSYHTNRYSVPDHLVGLFISVKISSHKISVYHENELLATHERQFGSHQWCIQLSHYLDTFKRKPGALSGSVALASAGYLKKLYEQYFQKEDRDFIDLLFYCRQKEIKDNKIKTAVHRLHQSGVREITSDKLISLLGNQQIPTPTPNSTADLITLGAQQQLTAQAALLN